MLSRSAYTLPRHVYVRARWYTGSVPGRNAEASHGHVQVTFPRPPVRGSATPRKLRSRSGIAARAEQSEARRSRSSRPTWVASACRAVAAPRGARDRVRRRTSWARRLLSGRVTGRRARARSSRERRRVRGSEVGREHGEPPAGPPQAGARAPLRPGQPGPADPPAGRGVAWVGEQRIRQIEREALQRLRAIATTSAARAA